MTRLKWCSERLVPCRKYNFRMDDDEEDEEKRVVRSKAQKL
jgi:hypothetical protein